jgi:hypothetical protein
MTAREQAIEAGMRAWSEFGLSMEEVVVAVVDAVEPIIRADEREKIRPAWDDDVDFANRMLVERDDALVTLATLREQIAQDLDYLASIATHPREALAFFAAARVARRGLHT